MKKKSLDYYLGLIKEGKSHGYDFNKYKDKEVGHLKNFVEVKAPNKLPRRKKTLKLTTRKKSKNK